MNNTTIKLIIILLAAFLVYAVFNTLYYTTHKEDTIKNKMAVLIGTIILEIVFIIIMIILLWISN